MAVQSVQEWLASQDSTTKLSPLPKIQPVSDWVKQNNITPEPTLIQKGVSAAYDYLQQSADVASNFGSALVTHPISSSISAIKEAFLNPAVQAEQAAGESLYNLFTGEGAAQKVADTAKLVSNTANALFSPITGLFEISSKIPGLKQVSDTLGLPFQAAGFAGSWASGKAIDWIPDSILPQESKDIIKQPIQDLFSLAGQVILGGKIMGKIGDVASKGETITPETAKKIVTEAQAEVKKIPVKSETPGTTQVDFSNRYTPPDQLPTIQTGPKAPDVLPVIQTETPAARAVKGDITIEPIQPVADWAKQNNIEIKPTPKSEPVVPQTPQEALAAKTPTIPQKTGKITKAASDVNKELVYQGFERLPPEEQSKYTPQSFREQGTVIAEMMTNDFETVRSMAVGETRVPAKLNEQSQNHSSSFQR